ncbi:MAG: hypothetical protein AAGA69_12575, partial [Pseudomonadota bacterium]
MQIFVDKVCTITYDLTMNYASAFLITIFSTATSAAQSDIEKGFSGAVRGCAEWVLNPASWTDGTDSFEAATELGDKMFRVQTLPDFAMPPP